MLITHVHNIFSVEYDDSLNNCIICCQFDIHVIDTIKYCGSIIMFSNKCDFFFIEILPVEEKNCLQLVWGN